MFEVNIDFDEASRAWMLNKKKNKYAHYQYKCQKITSKGKKCKNLADTTNIFINGFFCKYHFRAAKLTEIKGHQLDTIQ